MNDRNARRSIAVLAITLALSTLLSAPASADNGTDTSPLREAVTAEGVMEHLAEFQSIASANGDTRAAGTSGYDESAEYVIGLLEAAGYLVTTQEFSYNQFVEPTSAALEQVSPNSVVYVDGTDFEVMSYSGNGDVTASVALIDPLLPPTGGSTSGCEDSDFAGFTEGNIALIQRGTCTFREKAVNADEAGASAVIIFNEGNIDPDRTSLLFGTLDPPQLDIPVVGTTFSLGNDIATLLSSQLVTMRVAVSGAAEREVTTFNVLADTPTGRADRTVVVGAHLDSVLAGPGINDNGSGSAAILETALQLAALDIETTNRVRFAFWGGEEDGLIGSEFYISQLTAREIKDHAVNLNFDMVGSPNYVRFVYDGDGSAFGTTGPNGSTRVEDVFNDYFASQGLETEPTEFDGRSDYFGFINNGIPAGGLFTGAEGIKSAEEAVIYGGTAGQPYDPCYHQACDTYPDNVNTVVLEQMADAIAHSTLTFAMTTSAINGTGRGGGNASLKMEMKGSHSFR